MINLELTEELKKFQDDMHKFAEEVFRPISRKYDLAEHQYPEELDMMRGMAHFDRKKKTDKPKAEKKESQGPRVGASMRAVISSEEISWGDPSFLIAEMAYEVDAMRLMTWKAASRLEAEKDIRRESYLAKLFAGETAMKITDHGVQILGGHGYIREHPVERYYRNARGIGILNSMAIV